MRAVYLPGPDFCFIFHDVDGFLLYKMGGLGSFYLIIHRADLARFLYFYHTLARGLAREFPYCSPLCHVSLWFIRSLLGVFFVISGSR